MGARYDYMFKFSNPSLEHQKKAKAIIYHIDFWHLLSLHFINNRQTGVDLYLHVYNVKMK